MYTREVRQTKTLSPTCPLFATDVNPFTGVMTIQQASDSRRLHRSEGGKVMTSRQAAIAFEQLGAVARIAGNIHGFLRFFRFSPRLG